MPLPQDRWGASPEAPPERLDRLRPSVTVEVVAPTVQLELIARADAED